VRSGAFALVLALVLVSLIPYWLRAKADTAADRYLSLRLNLAIAADALDDDFTWQQYKTSHEKAESMPLSQLVEASVESPTSTESRSNTVRSKPKPGAANKTQQTVAPAPPSNIRLSQGIYGVHEIAGVLVNLDDSDLLSASRAASAFLDYSIYRWTRKRFSLIHLNMRATTAVLVQAQQSDARKTESLEPSIGKEVLLKYLTLRDARELARYELPSIPDTPEYRGSGRAIEASLNSLPRNLFWASLLAQVLLVFVIMYFGAFAREAAASVSFPVPGTLFSAFSRPRWNGFVFFLALWTPFLASASVAIASRRWPLIGTSVLVGLAIFSGHIVLHRKSYFDFLTLRFLSKAKKKAA